MARSFARAPRVFAFVCLALGSLVGSRAFGGEDARSVSTEPSSRVVPVIATEGAVRAVTYPALEGAASRPPLVYLHGICGGPDNGCSALSGAATRVGPLVCPQGNVACGGNHSWGGSPTQRIESVFRSLGVASARTGVAQSAERPGILIGFSQGAYLATDVAAARPGAFRGLLLVGASVTIDAAGLTKHGVRRVVLAAGRYDGARDDMRKTAATLASQRFEARFIDLGSVGHTYVPSPDRAGAIEEALDWLSEVVSPAVTAAGASGART